MSEVIAVELKNQLSEIARLARIVDDFGRRHQIKAQVIYNMKLALDEILTNVISYGYDDAGEHQITARFCLEQGKWTAEVEDSGRPFNPLTSPEANTKQSLEARPIGGLGIHLVRKLIDESEYRRQNDKNLLVMRINLKGP
jgi:anti-sigma regulatory factor (Ser/Thr protein kinase)